MFIQSSTPRSTPFLGILKMLDMHPSLARMLRIAHDATANLPRPIQTLAQLQARLDVSAQVMHNWKSRGVSKVGAILAAKEFDCAVSAILDDPEDGPEAIPSKEGPLARGGLAQKLSLRPAMVIPTVVWGSSMTNQDLPAEFQTVLVDDAMAPKAPMGSRVRLRRDTKAMPGDAVLVCDNTGEVYFREFIGGLHGRWHASATNPAYPSLDSEDHGLRVLAVFVGMDASWSQLTR